MMSRFGTRIPSWKAAAAVSALLVAALVVVAFRFAAGATASGGPQAMQTIDAKTDPAAAGKALDFCAVSSNCKFVQSGDIKVDYDAPRALGDALYNCGEADAEDEVTISDERSESNSVEESMSLKASLAFIGLAKASVEAEVNSKQLDEVATKLQQTNSVSVEPGTIGYTETRVPTAYLKGDTHVTDGVNLFNVTNLELTYPGYGNKAINKIDWTNRHKEMTEQDRRDNCAGLPPLYPSNAVASRPRSAHASVRVCAAGHGGCGHARPVTGVGQSVPAGTKLTLARGRVIYATGTAGKRRALLYARRRIPAGAYQLALSGRDDTSMVGVRVG
jgi:hypothetical protein